jgi:DNA replication protein DnaC
MPTKLTTPPPSPEDLRRLLTDLNLTTLAREVDALLAKAAADAPSYSDFLGQALEVEKSARGERKIQRRLRWSRLGAVPGLESFDFSARPQLSAAAVRELATCRFVEEGRNVLLVGRPSTGKTTVAKALGHAACLRGHSVYYATMADMLAELHASKADGTYRKAFRRVTQPALLILDDAGFTPLAGEPAAELFRVVCARYQRVSTIVISNLPFRQWGEFLASTALAVAIADRLVDQATILRFSGKSFRGPRDVLGAPLEGEPA